MSDQERDLAKYLRGRIWWVKGTRPDTGRYIRESLGTSDEALAEAKVDEIWLKARNRRILGADAPKPEAELIFAAAVLLYDAPKADKRYLIPIIKKIGKQRVRDITPLFVRKLAKELYPEAATDTWRRQVVSPVRAVINNAHGLGKCPPIRIAGYSEKERIEQDRLRGRRSREERTPGSWEWLSAFTAHAEPCDAALAFFMFRHGYRVGQSIAPTRSEDLDLGKGLLRVHASKGHDAHWVQLDPEEVVMIANLRLPKSHRDARDRVFFIGSTRHLYRRWQKTCERAGIAYLPPHSAGRHGYGTEMIVRQNIDPVSAADNLWADPSVMLKTYSHSEAAQTIVRDAMARGRAQFRTPSVQSDSAEEPKALQAKKKR
jgi:integrase